MSKFFGRKTVLDRIREHQRSGRHVSVVGPRSIGKTALLEAMVAEHAKGSDIFTGAGLVDFRHDPPNSAEEALRRVARVLRSVFESSADVELKGLANEIHCDATPQDLYDQMKIALDVLGESKKRVLLVLDGCDPVLQNSSIPRGLWDSLRALAQTSSLRLVTGSRDQLHRLCYNPEARTSDFFRIFYDEPIVVGPFDGDDWADLYGSCGLTLDGSAQKELVNWTGGHPDLIDALLARVLELAKDSNASKADVDAAAEGLAARANGRVEALWMDCSDESRGDIEQLTRGDVSAADMPRDRVRYLIERGLAIESGRKVVLANRLVERLAGVRKDDVSSARRMFERPEDFATNIRTVLELRLAQVRGGDAELVKLVGRAVRHLPFEPDAVLGGARDILDRALKLVWSAEAPGGIVPSRWVDQWKDAEIKTGRPIRAATDYSRAPAIPDERGLQCGLLRLATGQQRIRPTTTKISKTTSVLIEHMNQVGDLKNHSDGDPTITMAVAFCMAAIELVESLARELSA